MRVGRCVAHRAQDVLLLSRFRLSFLQVLSALNFDLPPRGQRITAPPSARNSRLAGPGPSDERGTWGKPRGTWGKPRAALGSASSFVRVGFGGLPVIVLEVFAGFSSGI